MAYQITLQAESLKDLYIAAGNLREQLRRDLGIPEPKPPKPEVKIEQVTPEHLRPYLLSYFKPTPVNTLGLSDQALSKLRTGGITKVGQLARIHEEALIVILRSKELLEEVKTATEELGLPIYKQYQYWGPTWLGRSTLRRIEEQSTLTEEESLEVYGPLPIEALIGHQLTKDQRAALQEHGYKRVNDLVSVSRMTLLSHRGIGRSTVEALRRRVADFGLRIPDRPVKDEQVPDAGELSGDEDPSASTDLLGLSPRVRNAFEDYWGEQPTLEQLAQLNEAELLRIPNIGRKAVKEIKLKAAAVGLTWG